MHRILYHTLISYRIYPDIRSGHFPYCGEFTYYK